MASTNPSVTSRGAYSSLNQCQNRIQGEQEHQPLTHGHVFPLQDKTSLTLDPMSDTESDIDHSQTSHDDFRVTFSDSHEAGTNIYERREDDEDDDDDDDDLDNLGDNSPLASSKRYYPRSGSIKNPSLPSSSSWSSRDWELNSYVPINITNGPKFARIVWKEGEEKQYLSVDCPHRPNCRYHLPSFTKDEFRDYPIASQGVDDLLTLGEEPYVFVLCPPGINQANIVFREFDRLKDLLLNAPSPHIDGTMEAPQPLLDDVVVILIDAISRASSLKK
ncbi:hypothetical protein BGZ65_004883 [Modicella reniformis]|uniref:Uncharacterized protein n=1 Tax=Modicella reniformis TaxID=1440133 RepID=A0A9P6LSS8_9FUNG|nr:hypothetical protein BGZ65_004883 [Modicella reniformis]